MYFRASIGFSTSSGPCISYVPPPPLLSSSPALIGPNTSILQYDPLLDSDRYMRLSKTCKHDKGTFEYDKLKSGVILTICNACRVILKYDGADPPEQPMTNNK
jgi:hypothetical protein